MTQSWSWPAKKHATIGREYPFGTFSAVKILCYTENATRVHVNSVQGHLSGVATLLLVVVGCLLVGCRVVNSSAFAQWGSCSRKYPYTHVPPMALNSTTPTMNAPVPIWANSGPGQAPVMAQPRPKRVPPMI